MMGSLSVRFGFTLTYDLTVYALWCVVCNADTDLLKCVNQLILSLRSTTTDTDGTDPTPTISSLHLYTTQHNSTAENILNIKIKNYNIIDEII